MYTGPKQINKYASSCTTLTPLFSSRIRSLFRFYLRYGSIIILLFFFPILL